MGAPIQIDLCEACAGSGWVRAHECRSCAGTGRRTSVAGAAVERPIDDDLRLELERTIRRSLRRPDAVYIAGAVVLSLMYAARASTPLRQLAGYGIDAAPVIAAAAAVIASHARAWNAPMETSRLAAWAEELRAEAREET